MKVVKLPFGEFAPVGPSVLTLGIFDGVHLGHQQLLHSALKGAQKRQLPAWAVTFDPHPAVLLAPEHRPCLITTLDQRLEAFRQQGMDGVCILPFSRAFSELCPHAFLERLERSFEPAELHVGRAFRFGRNRKGDMGTLNAWAQGSGCEVHPHAFKAFDGGTLSSTRIRKALDAGQVDEARALLGRPFSLTGIVVEGDRRGRHMGFPTANLAWEQEQLPASGVYVTQVHGVHAPEVMLGLTNIGYKPTLRHEDPILTVETHVPGFQGDLYGSRLEVGFLHRLRGEQRFQDIKALQAQIAADVAGGQAWWMSARP